MWVGIYMGKDFFEFKEEIQIKSIKFMNACLSDILALKKSIKELDFNLEWYITVQKQNKGGKLKKIQPT